MKISRIIISLCLACMLVFACATQAIAFCGFYVGDADAKLFDRAFQVVITQNINSKINFPTAPLKSGANSPF